MLDEFYIKENGRFKLCDVEKYSNFIMGHTIVLNMLLKQVEVYDKKDMTLIAKRILPEKYK